jgi:hypothetical protein
MARVSIYVPDPMKVQMDEIGERVNWSNAAQEAFAREIHRTAWPKEPTMENVIERLRASKLEFENREKAEGLKHGREWAMRYAPYDTMRKMVAIDLQRASDGSYGDYVDRVMGVTEAEESFWFDGEILQNPSDEYVEAYLEGVTEVWDQVSGQL